MKESYKEALKYGAVGVVGLGIEWGGYFLFRDVLNMNYIAAHFLGSVLAITNNFVLNSYFTFKATDKIFKRAAYFFGIAAVGLACSTLLLPIFVKLLNLIISYQDTFTINQKVVQNLAKLGATGLVVIMQFFLNKYITFKKKEA